MDKGDKSRNDTGSPSEVRRSWLAISSLGAIFGAALMGIFTLHGPLHHHPERPPHGVVVVLSDEDDPRKAVVVQAVGEVFYDTENQELSPSPSVDLHNVSPTQRFFRASSELLTLAAAYPDGISDTSSINQAEFWISELEELQDDLEDEGWEPAMVSQLDNLRTNVKFAGSLPKEFRTDSDKAMSVRLNLVNSRFLKVVGAICQMGEEAI